ncbi:MAG: Leucine-rich repeat (LRR) protein [Glaciecola sp.]|jgi:Leucine-rich repeat (LRR) protein
MCQYEIFVDVMSIKKKSPLFLECFNVNKMLCWMMLFCVSSSLLAQNVDIPDVAFKSCLLADEDINTNKDQEIQISEAALATDIVCVGKGINDVKGIEAFVGLNHLDCSSNNLDSIDVSHNKELNVLRCFNNKIKALDLSQNNNIWHLSCGGNLIDSLNVDSISTLQYLSCGGNELKYLAIDQNVNLGYLSCGGTEITEFDLSKNTQLQELHVPYSQLKMLDVSNNINLTKLNASFNSLSEIDFTNNSKLAEIDLEENNLDSLDLSYLIYLKVVICPSNELKFIDVTHAWRIENLVVVKNKLQVLSLETNSNLTHLNCYENEIKSLDLSLNTNLVYVNCHKNKLLYLNVKNEKNSNIWGFWAFDNADLKCITVDDPVLSEQVWAEIDDHTSFGANCSINSNQLNSGTVPDMMIYPNPFTDWIKVDFSETETISIYSLDGSLVYSTKPTYDLIDVSFLSSGSYMVQQSSSYVLIVKQ